MVVCEQHHREATDGRAMTQRRDKDNTTGLTLHRVTTCAY